MPDYHIQKFNAVFGHGNGGTAENLVGNAFTAQLNVGKGRVYGSQSVGFVCLAAGCLCRGFCCRFIGGLFFEFLGFKVQDGVSGLHNDVRGTHRLSQAVLGNGGADGRLNDVVQAVVGFVHGGENPVKGFNVHNAPPCCSVYIDVLLLGGGQTLRISVPGENLLGVAGNTVQLGDFDFQAGFGMHGDNTAEAGYHSLFPFRKNKEGLENNDEDNDSGKNDEVFDVLANGQKFVNENFALFEFKDVDFCNKRFFACSFFKAKFKDCKAKESQFTTCILDYTKIKDCNLKSCHFKYSILGGSYLKRVDFKHSDIINCNFVGTNIKKCDFSDSDLYGSDFKNSSLDEVDFIDCNLKRANFEFTTRSDTKFKYSNFEEAIFSKEQK